LVRFQSVSSFRSFFLGFLGFAAFCHNGFVEAGSEGGWELVQLIIAVNFDGLPGGVEDDVAFMAPMQVLIQLNLKAFGDPAVEIIRQFLQKVFTLH
jgi:hypothetical protein